MEKDKHFSSSVILELMSELVVKNNLEFIKYKDVEIKRESVKLKQAEIDELEQKAKLQSIIEKGVKI